MRTIPISRGSGRTIERILLSFLRISPLYRKNLALQTRSSSDLALALTRGRASQFPRAVVRFPSAPVLARLAREPQRSFSLPPLEPIYLREPHITMPK